MKLNKYVLTIYHSIVLFPVSAFRGIKIYSTRHANCKAAIQSKIFPGALETKPNLQPTRKTPIHMMSNRKQSNVSYRTASLKLAVSSLMPLPFLFTDAIPVTSLLDILHKIASDTNLASEILNDMAHVAMDLLTFVTSKRLILRLASMFGRVMMITSDYLPDQAILPDELMFQTVMLSVTVAQVVESAADTMKVLGLHESMTFRDRIAYKKLFSPTGMSLLQFRKLMAAAEWIEVPPNTIISSFANGLNEASPCTSQNEEESEQFMYWLYEGETEVVFSDSSRHVIDTKRGTNPNDIGLFGDVQFSKRLEARKNRKVRKSNTKDGDSEAGAFLKQAMAMVKSGDKGATYMRINTTKLLRLMEEDAKLDLSIQSILIQGMRGKLGALLKSKGTGSDPVHT